MSLKIGVKISELRKNKGLNRTELGKIVGTSGAVIGRYESEEITPSVEIAKKIADALDVSLDYLTGSTSILIDKKMLNRLELLQRVDTKQRATILEVMDSLLQTYNIAITQKKLA